MNTWRAPPGTGVEMGAFSCPSSRTLVSTARPWIYIITRESKLCIVTTHKPCQFVSAIASLTNFNLASERGLITHLNGNVCLHRRAPNNRSTSPTVTLTERETYNVPNVRLVKLGLKLLANRCLDIEYREGTSDIEEQDPESKQSPRTYPVNRPGSVENPQLGERGRARLA